MRHLKLFFACALMSLFSLGQVWADTGDATLTYSDEGIANSTSVDGTSYAVGAYFTVTCTKNSAGTAPTYYTTGTAVRCYATKSTSNGNIITVSRTSDGASANAYITKVTYTGTHSKKGTTSFTYSGTPTESDATSATYDSADEVTEASATLCETGGSANGQFYLTSVTVEYVYTTGGGSTPSLTASPTTIDFGTVEKDAIVGDEAVTVTFSNLTGSVTYSGLEGTVFDAAGTITSTGDEITISADASTVGVYEETLTIQSASDSKSQEVTVRMNVVEPFDGLKLTFDVSSNPGEWPTTNDASLTNYTYTLSAVDYTFALKNVKCNSGYLMMTATAVLGLPAIESYKLVKVEATNSGSCSTSTQVKITSDEAGSTLVTGGTAQTFSTTSTKYTYTLSGTETNTMYYLIASNKNCQLVTLDLYYEAASAPAVNAPTITGTESFVTSTTVTLACTTDGATIYYTTDGSDPKTSGSIGTSFSLTETKTVRAIAKLGSDWSEEATPKTFTKVTALTTMAEVQAAATTTTDQPINVAISNWVVSAVSGSQVWIADADNTKGILLYKSGHGFTAGKKLNGTVIGTKIKLYNLYPELTSLVSTEVTVTDAAAIAPRTTTIAALTSGHPAEQGTVVKLENVEYSSATSMLSDGVNSIAADNKFFSSLTLIDGTTYDITGVVTYYKDGDDPVVKIAPRTIDDVEAQTPIIIPTAANLAALKAAERGTYILTLTDAVITYVNGKNAFIEEGTTGGLIFLDGHGYSAGDCLNGDYQVTTTTYQGKFEITAIEPQAGAATTTAAIPLTTVSIATLNASFASYESRRIKIVGANVTDAISGSDRNGTINDGAELAVYAAVASTITLTASDNVDIIGYPGFHNTDQQLTVWQQSDITVNEKDPAGIAFTPESETITGGDPWSAPAFANPNSLTVTFSGDNDAVATVNTTTGEITLEGGYGTAVITAHTDGDATHASATVTYTITVNDPAATPVYTMSFDMTRASYDDAADAQVVWNSNVVTMTADKNDGTKVTNYLAGNYSGTTHIAETRLYAKNSISFVPQSGVTITKIEWMSTAKGYATKLAAETFVNATAVVDGTDDKLVIITPSAAGEISVTLTDAARATRVTVYYEAASEKAKLAASIAIADINMAVGDDDILLSAIAATSNPNKKAISYEVTSGTAVTIEGTGAEAALHAAAEGSATITATIPDDLGNYTGATTSFMVTVSAAATLESIAISGTATELEYTEGQSFNPTGLTVMGHYSNGSDEEITSGIDWTFAPDPLTEGTTSVSVTATVNAITSPAFVVNGLTVSGPAPVGDNYVKVTASQTDWSGDYILVYEDGTDAYVWNGDYSDGASNYASATITSNTIAKPAAAAVITIAAASEGKYTLQVNGDKYFQDNGSNSKLIFTDAIADAAEVTISYETDWTQLLFSERCIRFNSSSGQTRFRFYAASSQQAVQLYKKEAPTPNYTRTVTVGKIGTLCVDHNVPDLTAAGATFYQIAGSDGNSIVFDEVTSLNAGEPYVFQATATTISLVYGSTHVDDPVAVQGMIGSFLGENVAIIESNKANILYIANNALYDCSDLVGGNLEVVANCCYINRAGVTPAHAPAHGVRRISLSKDVATGFDQLETSEAPMKLIMDGRLYILRGEKLYDATGRLVK